MPIDENTVLDLQHRVARLESLLTALKIAASVLGVGAVTLAAYVGWVHSKAKEIDTVRADALSVIGEAQRSGVDNLKETKEVLVKDLKIERARLFRLEISSDIPVQQNNRKGVAAKELGSVDNRFCALTAAGFEDLDSEGEPAYCRVVQREGKWWLEAELGRTDDADAACAARCLTWPGP